MDSFVVGSTRNRCGEWVVRCWRGGVRYPAGDYFTEDLDDAHGTCVALNNQAVGLMSKGVRSDGERWEAWWILKPGSDIPEFIDENNIYQSDGYPGYPYSNKACVRKTRSGVVVITQSGGLDI